VGIIPAEVIERKIYLIRGQKVMIDRELAELYGVETRVLNQAVRRNISRFPPDFMFSLTREEIMNLSQIVISSRIKHAPNVFVFTEQGVAMLSSILNNDRAVQVNIAIMRAFVKLREVLSTSKELAHKLEEVERKIENHDDEIKLIFDAIRQLMTPPEKEGKKQRKRYWKSCRG
jgi:ORF6N domain-containing protein